MAHADYDCCAVCDRKMAYNAFDARTKEAVCADCAFGMAKLGIPEPTVAALMTWMRETPKDDLHAGLATLGFHPCCYGNDVDALVTARLAPAEATL